MDSFVYTRDSDGVLITGKPSLQEVRFGKAMVWIVKKLGERTRNRGSSIDTKLFGRVAYSERRLGRAWYGKISFIDKQLEYSELRHGVQYALYKITGELVSLSVNLDYSACEFRFLDGRPLSEKL